MSRTKVQLVSDIVGNVSGGASFTGIVTATKFIGDISEATGAAAGLGTALSQVQSSPLNKIYFTNQVLSIGSTITVDPPDSSNVAYTQYAEIAVEQGYDLIVEDGDDLVPDILGLSTVTAAPLSGAGGRVRADQFTNKAGTGAPNFPNGVQVTGVSTLGNTVVGGGTTQLVVTGNARITGILTIGTSSITLDGSSNQVNVGTGVTLHHTNGVQVGGNTLHSTVLTVNNINASGVITATSFSGSGANLTGIAATTDVRTNSLVVSGMTTATGGIQVGVTTSITVGDTFIRSNSIGIGTTTTTGRNAGVGTATGTLIFNSTLNQLQVYNGSSWVGTAATVRGLSPDFPAESANDIKTDYGFTPENGYYWIRQFGETSFSHFCIFKDSTGADIAGGPWTVAMVNNKASSDFSTTFSTAVTTYLNMCKGIGVDKPGRGMESTRTTTEVHGAWLAVKRAIWETNSGFWGSSAVGGVLLMPMLNSNGTSAPSAHRLIYDTSKSTHLPANIDGDACNAGQLFCGHWGANDYASWTTNNNSIPGPEDWDPSNGTNATYGKNSQNPLVVTCVYK